MFCLCETNLSGEITRCTPAFEKLVNRNGNPPQPPPPSNSSRPLLLSELIHPEDRAEFMGELDRILAGDRQMDKRAVRLVTPDGRVMLMEASGETLRRQDDVSGAILSWGEERKSEEVVSFDPEKDMESLQELLNNFTSSLFDPVVLLNTEGRIVHINAPALELLGYRRVDLIGNPVAVLFEQRPDLIPKAMARFARAMRSGQIRAASLVWVTREGAKIPVTVSSSMIRSASGELVGMVMVARDERENALLKDLEQKNKELGKAFQELKELDNMKDDFLSLVGHELRAPLANILGYTEFLKEWDISLKERKEFVEIIYQESQHLRRLVDDILDLSRMEAGRVVYNFIRTSMNRTVQTAIDTLKPMADRKQIRIITNYNDQLEPVEMDPDRIKQVVSNIIHNAIKFSDPGKSITVTTEEVEGGIRVCIADEGIGIPREFGAKVFNKFEQVASIKHHSEGAGLGMPIAKLIIEDGHKGRIWFESQGEEGPGGGQGTTFRFVIPERRPES
ncbi:MAG TPA: PAS domain-containing sensor histidine kinase [bacterium]|nr:PAS domain-containing sensor histidine kinase [bacterium]